MIRNYLKIAVRNLLRRRGIAFINVAGLAVGMAACLLIALYVAHEFSYDRFHANAERIYRVASTFRTGSETHRLAISQAPLGPALQQTFPEVRAYARLSEDEFVFRHEDRQFREKELFYADPSLFQVFSFTLVRGDTATALDAPFSVVLSQEAAQKYFGEADPIGQMLTGDGEHTFTVTGVLEAVPAASHLQFDVLVSMATREAIHPGRLDDWFDTWVHTYLLLSENARPEAVEAQLPDFVQRRIGAQLAQLGLGLDLLLQPLPSLHLHSDRLGEPSPAGNPATLYVFACVAFFLLLIACVNFMNLATARSSERAREVGVRKVVGAHRRGLILQFLTESVLLALIGMGMALLLAELAMPAFRALSGKTLERGVLLQPEVVGLLFGLALFVGLLAGSYPAFVLSRFQPVMVLKGRFQASRQGALLRKGLVVFQFAISVALIACTAIVYAQLGFLQTRDLGFAAEQKVVLRLGGDGLPRERVLTLKEALLEHPAVRGATASTDVPGDDYSIAAIELEHPDHEMRRVSLNYFMIDPDFLDEYGLELVAGRAFRPEELSDTIRTMLVNEAAVEHFGYAAPEEILGKRFRFNPFEGEVIGVVRDFHYASLHRPIEPFAFWIAPGGFSHLTLRVETADLPGTLAGLERTWAKLVPQRTFDYLFMDDVFAEAYEADRQFGRLFGVFAGLAVFIACLGLLGLASFATVQRTKEIGVRKVLGATVPEIVALLSKDFLVLVLVGFVIAAPAAYVAMSRWLDRFAFRIDISWWIFLLAGLAALGVALATISVQTIRAATADPVKALRYE